MNKEAGTLLLGGIDFRKGGSSGKLYGLEKGGRRRAALPSLESVLATPILLPENSGYGNWIGAGNVYFREPRNPGEKGHFVAVVRDRKPEIKGSRLRDEQGDNGRGASVKIYTSEYADFKEKKLVSTIMKSELNEVIPDGIDSFERAALDFTPEGKTVMYLSRSIKDTKDWDIVRIESKYPEKSDDPYDFDLSTAKILHSIEDKDNKAVKDPVIHRDGKLLHMYFTAHKLNDGNDQATRDSNADQMWTEHVVSIDDGNTWTKPEVVLDTREGKWDSRGARLTAVLWDEVNYEPVAVYYDGRSSPEENYYEKLGIAVWNSMDRCFEPLSEVPEAYSPHPARNTDGEPIKKSNGAIRYSSFVKKDGKIFVYYEATMENGEHGTFMQEFPMSSSVLSLPMMAT